MSEKITFTWDGKADSYVAEEVATHHNPESGSHVPEFNYPVFSEAIVNSLVLLFISAPYIAAGAILALGGRAIHQKVFLPWQENRRIALGQTLHAVSLITEHIIVLRTYAESYAEDDPSRAMLLKRIDTIERMVDSSIRPDDYAKMNRQLNQIILQLKVLRSHEFKRRLPRLPKH